MYGGSGDADDQTSSESEPDLDTVKTSPSVHTAQNDNPFKGKKYFKDKKNLSKVNKTRLN